MTGSEVHMGCRGLNPGWPNTRQASHPLYYCPSPTIHVFYAALTCSFSGLSFKIFHKSISCQMNLQELDWRCPAGVFYHAQFSLDFPWFSEDSFCLFSWNTIFTSPDMQKMFWESEFSFPRILFMLSNYSPWDHYILPMMKDYYCFLLVISWL